MSEGCQGPIRGNAGEVNPCVLSCWPYALSESTFALNVSGACEFLL